MRWRMLLTEIPTRLQHLIARTHRISLPRNTSREERSTRLAHALCHRSTVLATYARLDRPTQDALHDLAQHYRGIALSSLVARYGSIRSLDQIRHTPTPQTMSEHLILLGWLLPRPASRNHPIRYLIPSELRTWMPPPLMFSTTGVSPVPSIPPIIRATTTLICALAEYAAHADPFPIGTPPSLASLHARWTHLDRNDEADISPFLFPLVEHLHLIAMQHDTAHLTLAGQRFFRFARQHQHQILIHAWITLPNPEVWLTALAPDTAAMNLPRFRRRLCHWVSHLPIV